MKELVEKKRHYALPQMKSCKINQFIAKCVNYRRIRKRTHGRWFAWRSLQNKMIWNVRNFLWEGGANIEGVLGKIRTSQNHIPFRSKCLFPWASCFWSFMGVFQNIWITGRQTSRRWCTWLTVLWICITFLGNLRLGLLSHCALPFAVQPLLGLVSMFCHYHESCYIVSYLVKCWTGNTEEWFTVYNKDLDFRYAKREDTALILQFIKELADYEKCLTKSLLMKNIGGMDFDKQKAEVIFAVVNGKKLALLFLSQFSTFLGRAGIYLEDLYVKPECRGKDMEKQFWKTGGHCCWTRLAD